MNKVEILAKFEESSKAYTDYLKYLTKDEFEYAPEGKWNAGEQTIHVLKSQKAINKGLKLPKFILKNRVGKANRPSKGYDQVVFRYQERLSEFSGKSGPKEYQPAKATHADLQRMLNGFKSAEETLIKALKKWTEEQMDEFILPHPLLGKVTVREMLYFSIYHIDHHQNLIKRYLKGV